MLEQARWRKDGRLAALPQDIQDKLAAWEEDRRLLAKTDLAAEQDAWRLQGNSERVVATKSAAWMKSKEPSLVTWWSSGVFIGPSKHPLCNYDPVLCVTRSNNKTCRLRPDDFFGGCFSFFLDSMVRVFNEVFSRFNVETADGREAGGVWL